MFKNIAIVCNSYGLELFNYVPQEKVKCLIAASNRPQYFEELQSVANKLGIAFLIQPLFNSDEYQNFYLQIEKLNIDLLLCYSYSMLIREDILKLVNYNAINLHTALLPKNQGPNPTQWALIQGETTTGTTLHYMDNAFDSGDIISQKKLDISLTDTWVNIDAKLHELSLELFKENIENILIGKNQRIPQDNSKATQTIRLTPNYPKIDFNVMPLIKVYNLIRAQVEPLLGAFIEYNNKREYFKQIVSLTELFKIKTQYVQNPYKIADFHLESIVKDEIKVLEESMNDSLNLNWYHDVFELSNSCTIGLKYKNILLGIVSFSNINFDDSSAYLDLYYNCESEKIYKKMALSLLLQFAFEELLLHKIYWNFSDDDKWQIEVFQQFDFPFEIIINHDMNKVTIFKKDLSA